MWPVTRIIVRGLRPDGQWDLSCGRRRARGPGHATGRRGSPCGRPPLSTVLTLVSRSRAPTCSLGSRFEARTLLRAAVTVPFVLPTIVVGSAFLAIIGSRGVLGGRFSLADSVWAILLAHLFFNYAVVVRTVGGLWSHLDPALDDAARTLGASRWRALREVTWPLLRPAVVSAAADRVPVLVHVVRCHPRARRRAARHARGRHQAGRRSIGSTSEPRACSRSCNSRPSSRCWSSSSWATNRRSVQQRLLPVDDVAHRPRARRALVPRRQPRGDGRRARHADGGARRAVAAHRVRVRVRLLPSARSRRRGSRRGSYLRSTRSATRWRSRRSRPRSRSPSEASPPSSSPAVRAGAAEGARRSTCC